jgi:hypothetical protein
MILNKLNKSSANASFAYASANGITSNEISVKPVLDIHRGEEIDDVRDCLFKVIYKCNYNAQADYEHIVKNINNNAENAEGIRFSEQDLHNAKEKMEKVRRTSRFSVHIIIASNHITSKNLKTKDPQNLEKIPQKFST